VRPVGSYCKDVSRCTVNGTLNTNTVTPNTVFDTVYPTYGFLTTKIST